MPAPTFTRPIQGAAPNQFVQSAQDENAINANLKLLWDAILATSSEEQIQEVLDAADLADASAISAAASSAAAGAASGRLDVGSFAELASVFVYSAPGAGQQVAAAGDTVLWRGAGVSYEILASGESDADLDYTGSGGVKFRAFEFAPGHIAARALGITGVATGGTAFDERAKIAAAFAAAGRVASDGGTCMVHFDPDRVYGITNVTRLDCPLPAGVGFDLHGSTITRVGGSINIPMIENANSGGATRDHVIRNGKLQGTGAAGNVSDQGSALLLLNADGTSLIEEIETINTNGDGLQFRNATVVMRNVIIGDYGRNGISPTSGDFVYDNVRITGSAITGANPGIALDAENNSAGEFGKHVFYYIEASDLTFVDFYASSGEQFRHDVRILAGKIGGAFRGVRFLAAEPTFTNSCYIGPQVELIANGNNGAAVTMNNVGGLHFDGGAITAGSGTGLSAFLFLGTVTGATIRSPRIDKLITNSIQSIGAVAISGIEWSGGYGRFPRFYLRNATECRFSNAFTANVTLSGAATVGNIFDPTFRVDEDQWTVVDGATKAAQRIGYILTEAEIDSEYSNVGPRLRFRGRSSFVDHTLGELSFFSDGEDDKGAGIKAVAGNTTEGELQFFTSQTTARLERMRIRTNGHVRFFVVPVHVDEAAAVAAGLDTGIIYRTPTGELRIKL